jgi:uncharacterized protein (TIGR03435 family)
MLQRLLAERFGLAAHREVRSMDGYELVVGPEGVKMREVEPIDELHKEFPPDPALNGRARRDATTETPEGAVRTISTPRGFRTVTSRTSYERTVVPGGGGIIDAARMTMTELVPWLWENLDRPVVDKTGLPGVYEFKIELPRDARGDRVFQSLGVNTTALPPSGGPSTMKAVEELGLKLERRQLPIEVIVVDKIAREPTAN